MIQRAVLLLFFFLCQCGLTAQDTKCGFTLSEAHLQYFKVLKQSEKRARQRSNEFTYIPVKFHAVADADGDGRIRFEKILDQLCAINENFRPLGFQFYMKDGSINEVDNNTVYKNPSSAAGTIKMVSEKNAVGKNAINIFITDNAGSTNIGEGTTLGYYDFNQDLIVLKKSAPSNNRQLGFVLGHELGHFFSLPHTFNGWDGQPWDGTPVSSTLSPGGVLNELADSSNCDVAGDMICDTPADYNLGFGWDGCRPYDGGCTDPNGALLDPDESNFMGYFIGCDKYFFSEGQSELIQNDYSGSRRSYLRVNFTPNAKEVGAIENLLLPEDDITTSSYNGVHLEWEPAENASHYLLELNQGLTKTYYVTSIPAIFLTELAPDKSYRWRVRPYNQLSTCTEFTRPFNFRTGEMTSATDEQQIEDDLFSVFPNPSNGEVLSIKIKKSEDNNEKTIVIRNIQGQVIFSSKFIENFKNFEQLNLESGIYFLYLEHNNKQFTKKLIVYAD